MHEDEEDLIEDKLTLK